MCKVQVNTSLHRDTATRLEDNSRVPLGVSLLTTQTQTALFNTPASSPLTGPIHTINSPSSSSKLLTPPSTTNSTHFVILFLLLFLLSFFDFPWILFICPKFQLHSKISSDLLSTINLTNSYTFQLFFCQQTQHTPINFCTSSSPNKTSSTDFKPPSSLLSSTNFTNSYTFQLLFCQQTQHTPINLHTSSNTNKPKPNSPLPQHPSSPSLSSATHSRTLPLPIALSRGLSRNTQNSCVWGK